MNIPYMTFSCYKKKIKKVQYFIQQTEKMTVIFPNMYLHKLTYEF